MKDHVVRAIKRPFQDQGVTRKAVCVAGVELCKEMNAVVCMNVPFLPGNLLVRLSFKMANGKVGTIFPEYNTETPSLVHID